MNIQEKINKKELKLGIIKQMLFEEVIDSQLKYLKYKAKEIELENEIKQLEKLIDNKSNKEWTNVGDGWIRRTSKRFLL